MIAEEICLLVGKFNDTKYIYIECHAAVCKEPCFLTLIIVINNSIYKTIDCHLSANISFIASLLLCQLRLDSVK